MEAAGRLYDSKKENKMIKHSTNLFSKGLINHNNGLWHYWHYVMLNRSFPA